MTSRVARLAVGVVAACLAGCSGETDPNSLTLADIAGTYARGLGLGLDGAQMGLGDVLVLEADGDARRTYCDFFRCGSWTLTAELDGRVLALREATSDGTPADTRVLQRLLVARGTGASISSTRACRRSSRAP